MNLKRGVFGVLCVVVGVLILAVSIAKATLDINAKDDNADRLRSNQFNFVVKNNNGTTESISYSLPTVSMLPSNPLYGFKRVRDYLWIQFAKGFVSKSKIGLLIADKKMAEARMLAENNQMKMAIETIKDAFDQLKSAYETLNYEAVETDEIRQLKIKEYEAGLAYVEILKPMGEAFDLDTEKYSQLVNDLNKWNEERKTEKETFGY
jgi:hypothetical protein